MPTYARDHHVNPTLDESRPFRLNLITYASGLEVAELWYRGIDGRPMTCVASWTDQPTATAAERVIPAYRLMNDLGVEETGYNNIIRKVDLGWKELERPVVQELLAAKPFSTVKWLTPPPEFSRSTIGLKG